ncbi:MAG TPA: BolA family protein [Rhodanobacteraceae bacterium]|nr:BolA family protein [Rhodanobacteraceae bacterium]
MSDRLERIRSCLEQALRPLQLDVEDESHRHAGHEGARDGRGHFRVRIVAPEFAGMPLIKRHQRVYAALGDMMRTDIHALALETSAPGELPER